jgi:hypothetical protein
MGANSRTKLSKIEPVRKRFALCGSLRLEA